MNTSSPIFWILYIVLLGGMLYFMAIRPQKKEKQRQQQLLNSVAVGHHIDQQRILRRYHRHDG